ncbi:phosphoglycerate kinase [Ferrimicrobium sp.]|uniref:phosphoglycerate kinase n=1 Tax=Ferrimicrobium sp. TaxID=2926050 RepID=UPI002629E3FF|nr:phosphoglycerate kinase [Ferrimicrobium sp.]
MTLSAIPSIDDLALAPGRRVLLRADLNVPLRTGPNGTQIVADAFRIDAALPTIARLRASGAEVVVCSHLGRPKGFDPRLTMEPIRAIIETHFPEVEVLENLRFDPREEANDPVFAAELAAGFDAFVNDAFGVSHRRHASIVGVPPLLPSAGGITLLEEVKHLTRLLEMPARPYVAVLGGAKVSDKLGLLNALVQQVDTLLVGGGMCFTFLAAEGIEVGDSLVEEQMIDQCQHLLATGKVVLPVDVMGLASNDSFGPDGGNGVAQRFGLGVPPGYRGLDIGAATIERFSEFLVGARSILWNGPMGVFEDPRFRLGTDGVAAAIGRSDAYSVVGGGDSVAALHQAGLAENVSHLSTGGGATLEYLEHGDLVGLAALRHSREP